MYAIITFIQGLVPTEFDFVRFLWIMLIGFGSALLLGILFRLILGKGSTINHCLSSAVAILFVYAFTILFYRIGNSLEIFLSPLPFVELSGDYLRIFSMHDASFSTICSELVSMIILSFLMNLFVTWLPNGEKAAGWFFFRFLSILIAICLLYVINLLMLSVFPAGFTKLAPVILFFILLLALLLGILKPIAGGALAMINPFLGILYTFFFSNLVGKQLIRSLWTTLIMVILVDLLNYLEITAIYVASIALIAYIPFIIIALVLWFVIGKLL
jgi:hypothetical protein